MLFPVFKVMMTSAAFGSSTIIAVSSSSSSSSSNIIVDVILIARGYIVALISRPFEGCNCSPVRPSPPDITTPNWTALSKLTRSFFMIPGEREPRTTHTELISSSNNVVHPGVQSTDACL